MRIGAIVFVLVLSLLLVPAFALADSCGSGSLGQMLGTSCTVGNLSLTFGKSFNGFTQFTDPNNQIITNSLDPNSIGFIPVLAGSRLGFKLVANFTDAPTVNFFSSHFASFQYTVQALNGGQISSVNDTIIGSINPLNTSDIAGFDQQCFADGICSVVGPTVNFNPGFGLFSNPSDTFSFVNCCGVTEVAGLTGQDSINDFAYRGASASLQSSTVLYSVSSVPEPNSVILLAVGLTTAFVGGFFRTTQSRRLAQ